MSDVNPKYDTNGRRLCDRIDCDEPATHLYSFMQIRMVCHSHALDAVERANQVGNSEPANTLRELTENEKWEHHVG